MITNLNQAETNDVSSRLRQIYDLPTSYIDQTFDASSAQPYDGAVGFRYDVKDAIGRGHVDIVDLSDSITLVTFDTCYDRHFQRWGAGEDLLNLRFITSGRLNVKITPNKYARFHDPFAVFGLYPKGTHCDATVEQENRFAGVSLFFRPEALLEHYGFEPSELPEEIRKFATNVCDELIIQPLSIPAKWLYIVNQLVTSPYVGTMRRLQFEAGAMELLTLSLEALGGNHDAQTALPGNIVINRRDIERLYEAREYILKNYAEFPTIIRIARHVGLNDHKLKHGFKHLFGTTIFEFCTKVRMDFAFQLLCDTDSLIGDVAHAAGYANVCSFTVAFKRHFGVLPKQLKKMRRV